MSRLGIILLAVLTVAACQREDRRWREPAAIHRPDGVPRSTLHPGPLPPRVEQSDPPTTPYRYDDNAWAISEGKRLFVAFNCSGCHAAGGGGGMGPPLRDGTWIYGADADTLFSTIVDGRPDGMPAFRNKLAEHDVWKLVAYVRALASLVPIDALSARDDHMRSSPSPILRDEPSVWPPRGARR